MKFIIDMGTSADFVNITLSALHLHLFVKNMPEEEQTFNIKEEGMQPDRIKALFTYLNDTELMERISVLL